MFRIQTGQPRVGKTKQVKKMIRELDKKKVIFDFNNDFTDISGIRVELEDYHPLIDDLSLEEVKVLNAGYLMTSHCLYQKAQDIYREEKVQKRNNVVQDTLERLNASWQEFEVEYYKELSNRIPTKIGAKQQSLNRIIDLIEENDTVIISQKSIHSDHLRAMMYFIIYKIHNHKNLDVKIIADEVSSLFFKGNLKLLFSVVNFKELDFLISCNRPSSIPMVLKDVVDAWSLFKNTDKSEVKWLKASFGVGKNIDMADIPMGQFKNLVKKRAI